MKLFEIDIVIGTDDDAVTVENVKHAVRELIARARRISPDRRIKWGMASIGVVEIPAEHPLTLKKSA